MRDISTILQNAILYVAGNEGVARFNKAGYGSAARDILRSDGSLDLPRLMNIMLDVFPEEQASAIADNVLAKYVEIADAENKKAHEAADNAGAPKADGGMSYKESLAKYLETEASDVQDLINEARMIRIAMGKASPSKGAVVLENTAPPEQPKVSIVNPVLPGRAHETKPEGVSIVTPPAQERPAIRVPATIELSHETLESEIKGFIEARKAYTSVDIMDFIRYLKDKGYHFQENSVLESVYTWVEERKSRERAALLADIQSFLGRMSWPTENEVSAYIEQKKGEGIMYESAEIKRMILVEMIKKH